MNYTISCYIIRNSQSIFSSVVEAITINLMIVSDTGELMHTVKLASMLAKFICGGSFLAGRPFNNVHAVSDLLNQKLIWVYGVAFPTSITNVACCVCVRINSSLF